MLIGLSRPFLPQALLQKRSMSVITIWLSSQLHQTEPWEDGDFHPFSHLTSCRPVPETAAYALLETLKCQAVIMEDPSILNSCSMKISLTYSWLNKSLALPLGCDVGPFLHCMGGMTYELRPASPG